jgi:hypothetical protein
MRVSPNCAGVSQHLRHNRTIGQRTIQYAHRLRYIFRTYAVTNPEGHVASGRAERDILFHTNLVTVQEGWPGGALPLQESLFSACVRGFAANTGRKERFAGPAAPAHPRGRRRSERLPNLAYRAKFV